MSNALRTLFAKETIIGQPGNEVVCPQVELAANGPVASARWATARPETRSTSCVQHYGERQVLRFALRTVVDYRKRSSNHLIHSRSSEQVAGSIELARFHGGQAAIRAGELPQLGVDAGRRPKPVVEDDPRRVAVRSA